MRAVSGLAAATLLALSGCLSGCSFSDKPTTFITPGPGAIATSTGAPSSAAPGDPADPEPTDAGPSGTAAAEPTKTAGSSTGSDCTIDKSARDTIPDGTWTGPIALSVRVRGGGTEFVDSREGGRIEVVVENGVIRSGTWSASWHSVGSADTISASATTTVDSIMSGMISGSASNPVLTGTWTLQGEAVITKPFKSSAPITETGKSTQSLSIRATDCDAVTGRLKVAFNTTQTLIDVTGTGRWTGGI